MYNKKGVNIYEDFGWNYFSLTMGQSIYDYIVNNQIVINKHLDLCSGTGELCNFLKNKGIDTKGVDLSLDMIDLAKNKFKDIPFILGNVVNYKDNENYDLITSTCDSINHLLSDFEIKTLFTNVYEMLNVNGYFIFDIFNKEKIDVNKSFISNRENNINVHYLVSNLGNNLINTNVKVEQNNEFIFEENVKERVYDKNEIISILENVGFKIEQCNDKITNEEQRVNNKIYFIVRKA